MNTNISVAFLVLGACFFALSVSHGQGGSTPPRGIVPDSNPNARGLSNAERVVYQYQGRLKPDDADSVARMHLAGLRGDRTQVPDMIKALESPVHWGYSITALHALARLGEVQALPVIEQKYMPRSIMAAGSGSIEGNYAQAARARLLAESSVRGMPGGKAKAAAKVARFYQELGMTAADLVPFSPRPQSLSLPPSDSRIYAVTHGDARTPAFYAMCELADVVYEGPYEDYAALPDVARVDFTKDYGLALKMRLAPLSRAERIATMVSELAHKKALRSEEDYEMQLLIDEGLPAGAAIAAQLREMDKHRDQYTHAGFAALFRVLQGIGDASRAPLIEPYLHDADTWVSYYADQVLPDIKKGIKRPMIFAY